ncbi:MAG: glycosyltransferase family 2 protein [Anaerolineae bacterium]
MDLGIVVVSYNTRQLTLDCLHSVYAALGASDLQAHVWVVDSASSDGSAAAVEQAFPQATVMACTDNLGFARGSNLGITQMLELPEPPRHVLLLNPDTLVSPDALTRLVTHLDEHPEVGVVGAQLAFGDGSFQHSAFRFPTLWMILFDFYPLHYRLIESRLNGRYPRAWYAAGEPFTIDHPLGAALMVRREVLQQVGLLDPDFFMYCEEIDWCMRIKSAGWQIHCVPRARVTHLGGQSTRQFRDRMYVALWRSRYRLFAKHYGALYRRLARALVHMGMRAETQRVRQAMGRGEISPEDADRRIAAFRAVKELS